MYQQAPFNNEPSSGSMELKLFSGCLELGRISLTMQCGLRGPWPSQCGIDANGSNKRKRPVNKGQVSQEMTNAGVVYNAVAGSS